MTHGRSFLQLAAVEDEPFRISPVWIKSVYDIRSCRDCHALLPEWRDKPLHMQCIEKPSGIMPIPVPLQLDCEIIRLDLYSYLRPWLTDFSAGTLVFDGRDLDYVALVANDAARVASRGSKLNQHWFCKTCGRPCEIVSGKELVEASSVNNREVWTSLGGGLYLSTLHYKAIPSEIAKFLKPRALIVHVA